MVQTRKVSQAIPELKSWLDRKTKLDLFGRLPQSWRTVWESSNTSAQCRRDGLEVEDRHSYVCVHRTQQLYGWTIYQDKEATLRTLYSYIKDREKQDHVRTCTAKQARSQFPPAQSNRTPWKQHHNLFRLLSPFRELYFFLFHLTFFSFFFIFSFLHVLLAPFFVNFSGWG
jgi:hypothetical protein